MPFIITDPCIDTKDTACVDVCPVDCIHPRKDEPEFERTRMLYIHPEECIDCGACVPACPVAAIYDSVESTPDSQKSLVEANAVFRSGDEGSLQKAEGLVTAHADAHPRRGDPDADAHPDAARRGHGDHAARQRRDRQHP